MSKLFIFDRDDTLIDENNQLINPEVIGDFFQEISQNDEIEWSIASAGATELADDPAYKGLVKQVPSLKLPSYIQLNRSFVNNILNKMVKGSFSGDIGHNIPGDWNLSDEFQLAALKINALLSGKLEEEKEHFVATYRVNNENLRFEFSKNVTVKLQLGETIFTIDLVQLMKEGERLLDKGDSKLFSVLIAINDAHFKLNLEECPLLQNIGILQIEAPENYTVIAQQDVIFCDDKQGCVDLMTKTGFKAILADTLSAKKTGIKNGTTDEHAPIDHYLTPLFSEIGINQALQAKIKKLCGVWDKDTYKNSFGHRQNTASNFLQACENLVHAVEKQDQKISAHILDALSERITQASQFGGAEGTSKISGTIYAGSRSVITHTAKTLKEKIASLKHDKNDNIININSNNAPG